MGEMMAYTRKELQDYYIRVCRDSGFRFSFTDAAIFAGNVLKVSPLEFWIAFSSMDLMEKIAAGKHPASHQPLNQTE